MPVARKRPFTFPLVRDPPFKKEDVLHADDIAEPPPVSSVICVTRREPSLMRAICTIRWTADAICARNRLLRQAHAAHHGHGLHGGARHRAACWRGLWSGKPSWPVFMAATCPMHSSPRTSPAQSGRDALRSALMTSSLCRHGALFLPRSRAGTQAALDSSRTNTRCSYVNLYINRHRLRTFNVFTKKSRENRHASRDTGASST